MEGSIVAREKKIKLKGSSFFDRHKPINKKRKKERVVNKSNSLTKKKKPINKITKQKQVVHKDNSRPYSNSNANKNNASTPRYLIDVIERRYIFVVIVTILCFIAIFFTIIDLVFTSDV